MNSALDNSGEIRYDFIPIEEIPLGVREQFQLVHSDDNVLFHKDYAKKIMAHYLKEKTEETEKSDAFLKGKIVPKLVLFYTGEFNKKELDAKFEDLKLRFASIGIKLKPTDVDYVSGDISNREDVERYLKRSDKAIKEDMLLATIGTFGCIVVYSDECLKNIGMDEGKIRKWLSGLKTHIHRILKKDP